MGLSITKQLVELHGGTIDLKSEVGRGSRFFFTLSATDRKPTANGEQVAGPLQDVRTHEKSENKKPKEEATIALGEAGFTVLVVDDESVNRHVLSNYMNLHGYSVLEATNGIEALKLVEDQGPPNLILLDVMMPKMSGYEVCSELRKTYAPNVFAGLAEAYGDGACGEGDFKRVGTEIVGSFELLCS